MQYLLVKTRMQNAFPPDLAPSDADTDHSDDAEF